jgi:PTS system mannitol-specific IIC component
MAMSPRGGLLPVLAGVVVATAVSFVVAAFFIKRSNSNFDESQLQDAKDRVKELKNVAPKTNVKRIIFACDAGMGSSAMGATTLRNKLKKAGLNIEVVNFAVNEVPVDAEIVVTHESLTDRARSRAPKAEHISIKNFMNAPEYDALVKRLS